MTEIDVRHRMTRDRNFPDQPAQYVNEIDGQDCHDQGNKKMFPFTEHIECGNDDSKRESNRDESAQVTHALDAWINHRRLLVERQFRIGNCTLKL